MCRPGARWGAGAARCRTSTSDWVSMLLSMKARRLEAAQAAQPRPALAWPARDAPWPRTAGLLIRGFGVRSPGGPPSPTAGLDGSKIDDEILRLIRCPRLADARDADDRRLDASGRLGATLPSVAEIARVFSHERWTLVGGLMAQLHCVQARFSPVRPTDAVDMVLHIETVRGFPAATAGALESLGYELAMPIEPCAAPSTLASSSMARKSR